MFKRAFGGGDIAKAAFYLLRVVLSQQSTKKQTSVLYLQGTELYRQPVSSEDEIAAFDNNYFGMM